MKKQRIQIEDYGVETFVEANATTEEEEQKQAVFTKAYELEQKQQREAAEKKVKAEMLAQLEAQSRAQEQQRKQANTQKAAQNVVAHDSYAKSGQMIEMGDEIPEDDKELAMNLYMTETLLIFRGSQFLLYDFSKKSSWQIGDCDNQFITVDEDSSIVMIDPQKHKTNEMQAIVTGGCKDNCMPGQQVISLNFQMVQKTQGDYYLCTIAQTIQPLRTARYMHQSAVIKGGKNNSWNLLIVGGKAGSRSWLNSVEMLDLSPYFRPGQVKTASDGSTSAVQSEWIQCAPMQCARSNFALVALSNFVYAYGGIAGSGDASNAHHPVLATEVIERYTIKADKWEAIKIASAPRIAAFSWTRLNTKPGHADEGKIVILGGTNGDIATEEFQIVDFNAETAMIKQTNFEFNTCMGTMVFHEGTDTIYHIGGMGSQGVDYKMKLGDTKWEQLDNNHSVVMNESGLELMNNSSIYFD